ncbi:MAG TPA: hypothetical protein VIL99_06020 [Ignavibacteria bacterium]
MKKIKMKNFSLPYALLMSFIMLIAGSCNKESGKPESNQDNKTTTTSNKDSIETKKENTAAGKIVTLSADEQKKLNTFFSNFSEAYLEPFTSGNITDDELIKFGILHNYNNNFRLFEKAGENELKIKDALISKSIEKYFGKTFSAHKSTKDYKYKNGYYFIPNADGEAYTFSQVTSLSDIGGDRYIAYINVYTASQAGPEMSTIIRKTGVLTAGKNPN